MLEKYVLKYYDHPCAVQYINMYVHMYQIMILLGLLLLQDRTSALGP